MNVIIAIGEHLLMYHLVKENFMDRKSLISTYHLNPEERTQMLKEIASFYAEEREEQIGIIASNQILDFFLDTLGKHIYNKALDDAQLWYKQMADNMEADYYALYKLL